MHVHVHNTASYWHATSINPEQECKCWGHAYAKTYIMQQHEWLRVLPIAGQAAGRCTASTGGNVNCHKMSPGSDTGDQVGAGGLL